MKLDFDLEDMIERLATKWGVSQAPPRKAQHRKQTDFRVVELYHPETGKRIVSLADPEGNIVSENDLSETEWEKIEDNSAETYAAFVRDSQQNADQMNPENLLRVLKHADAGTKADGVPKDTHFDPIAAEYILENGAGVLAEMLDGDTVTSNFTVEDLPEGVEQRSFSAKRYLSTIKAWAKKTNTSTDAPSKPAMLAGYAFMEELTEELQRRVDAGAYVRVSPKHTALQAQSKKLDLLPVVNSSVSIDETVEDTPVVSLDTEGDLVDLATSYFVTERLQQQGRTPTGSAKRSHLAGGAYVFLNWYRENVDPTEVSATEFASAMREYVDTRLQEDNVSAEEQKEWLGAAQEWILLGLAEDTFKPKITPEGETEHSAVKAYEAKRERLPVGDSTLNKFAVSAASMVGNDYEGFGKRKALPQLLRYHWLHNEFETQSVKFQSPQLPSSNAQESMSYHSFKMHESVLSHVRARADTYVDVISQYDDLDKRVAELGDDFTYADVADSAAEMLRKVDPVVRDQTFVQLGNRTPLKTPGSWSGADARSTYLTGSIGVQLLMNETLKRRL